MLEKKYLISIFLLTTFLCLTVKSQNNSLITSFNYSSNTTTYGRLNTLIEQPSYSPGISFYSKHGFDITGVFYVLDNSDSAYENATQEFDIILGYEWEPFKNFIVYPSISQYFYSKNSSSFKSGFTNNFQLDIDYSLSIFISGISGNYLLGEKNTGLLSIRNSILLEKEDFIFDNLYVAIQPGVDLIWGNQTYYNNRFEVYYENNPDALDRHLNKIKEDQPFRYNLIKQYLINNPDVEIYDVLILFFPNAYDIKDEFNLNALTINLPLFFMIGSKLSVMANMMYYKPINTPDYIENDWKFLWNTGIYYTFNL